MALTDAQKTTAKARAKEYLEYCIYTLCLALPEAPEDIDSSFVIPVDSDHALYNAYDCLKKHVAAHEALG